MKTIRVALYTRVSKASKTKHGDTLAFDQDPAVQEKPLRELVAQRGWQLHRIYSDRVSGAKERRPGLDALMADARRGEFDVVAVWRFDRFARSVKHLVTALDEFHALRIDFVSLRESIDTSTPLGKAMFTIIGAMAELERSVIVERVRAGLEYARENGSRSGKPCGRPRLVFDREKVLQLRQAGLSIDAIGRQMQLSVGTVCRSLSTNGNGTFHNPPCAETVPAVQLRRLA